MSRQDSIEKLASNIERYFERHASRCLVRALAITLVCAGSIAGLSHYFVSSQFTTIVAFGVSSFISLNAAFIFFVPSTRRRKEAQQLILMAAADPSAIENVSPGVIALRGLNGDVRELNKVEQQAWKELVVPFHCSMHSTSLSEGRITGERALTRSEIRQFKEQRKELAATEARMREDREALEIQRGEIASLQQSLSAEQESLERARNEVQERSDSLQDAENMVITRLSEIEIAEAEMEQMRENISVEQAAASSKADPEYAARLKAKEVELEALRRSLDEDKFMVEQQKTELNQLKGELIRSTDSEDAPGLTADQSLAIREQALAEQLKKLQEATSELEERTQYVNEVEDSLGDRLNAISEREAFVEQGEINAGLRED